MTPVLLTDRLELRALDASDAAFILRLLNEPSFLRHIGDKKVRTLDDARRYIDTGPAASYARHGFGLLRVGLRESGLAAGICGLLQRDTLPGPDLGFAFLPAYWSCGYARESAQAVLRDARERLGLDRILAITSPDNDGSARLLLRLGFRHETTRPLVEGGEALKLYAFRSDAS